MVEIAEPFAMRIKADNNETFSRMAMFLFKIFLFVTLAALLALSPASASGFVSAETKAAHSAGTCTDVDAAQEHAGTIVKDLDENYELVAIPCFFGAYNFSHRLYLQYKKDKSLAEALFWPTYSAELGWGGTDQLFLMSFDPETKEVTSFYKGRGLGDCGSSALWRWQDYGFKLIEYRFKEKCDGNPGDFPVVFKSK